MAVNKHLGAEIHIRSSARAESAELSVSLEKKKSFFFLEIFKFKILIAPVQRLITWWLFQLQTIRP